ncbi:1-deoxy-D-xylulose-5-phosphate reductoisomerase [Kocuria rhizophila]|uniref:1-deoxy-D-xylulose-5-phosphate reductoisomerase n=1 Tax=Kocuria rhizophila TaxID=72000 RepID=UPI001EF71729|nr:1-deoxy-D-xylulose-5-phosphate reductoisomerase [Kocuria rhizophila]MCG7425227.1 1-deoxy-D-xylulose-5-phosphate reductoisomerase [Kocuria rhizophila]MCT2250118.1 1-deoxy-D-xylulose-5-phosphate reductoisomerase [Kocuria rhizophila]
MTSAAMTPDLDRATREAPRRLVVLGSTGSIGTQALEVVGAAARLARPESGATHPPFEVLALAAGAGHLELLAQQAVDFGVAAVATSGSAQDAARLGELIDDAARAARSSAPRPEILHGPRAAAQVAAWECADVVLNGITGSIGLEPTLAALGAGHRVALANKESLIAGGPLVQRAAAATGLVDALIPVDSEHSAIAQALRSGTAGEVDRLVLTASGGPFRGMTREQLAHVNPEQALRHPTWDMGPMVTTNSATLVNKALEVLEASLLFDVPLERIDVTVHPQSVVHSMVQFTDGSTLAQASPPDMRLPIALGIAWPHRVTGAAAACDWTRAAEWTFEPLDAEAFPAVELIKHAGALGGTWPAVFNAANEQAVHAFHRGELGFLQIVELVSRVVDEHDGVREPRLEDVLEAETWARARADERIAGGR